LSTVPKRKVSKKGGRSLVVHRLQAKKNEKDKKKEKQGQKFKSNRFS